MSAVRYDFVKEELIGAPASMCPPIRGTSGGSSSEVQQSRRGWAMRRTELAESLRRSVAFQWFFTAFSVRPTITFAMSAHLLATTGNLS